MLLSSKQTRKERSSTEIRDILRGIHFTLQSSSADQERTQGGNSLHHEVATQMSLTMIMLMMVMMMVMMMVTMMVMMMMMMVLMMVPENDGDDDDGARK